MLSPLGRLQWRTANIFMKILKPFFDQVLVAVGEFKGLRITVPLTNVV